MSLSVEKVSGKKQLKAFVQFQIDLYKGNPNFVVPLKSFELGTFNQKKNPAFENCEAELYLVTRNDEIVGRVAAIVHKEELSNEQKVRFGWIDFTEDYEVFEKLIYLVEEYARKHNAKQIHGPLGFTDLDFEGTLIEGYDKLATQATIYNFPYYKDFFEKKGFEKACDWVEVRGNIPNEMPKRLARSAQFVRNRFKFKPVEAKNSKALLPYGEGVFNLLNKAYDGLYGYHKLSDKQIEYYIDQYFGFIRKEYVSIIVDENDTVVGFAISLPSFSKALNKAKGNLFPFGFIHVLKALRSNDDMDLFLIAVDPDYQKLGVNVLIFHQLFEAYIKNGVKTAATGPMLENNFNVLNLWQEFDEHIDENNIRRRCFIKSV